MALPDGFKLSGGKILDSLGNPVIMIDSALEAGMALPAGYKLSGGRVIDSLGNPVVIAVGTDGNPLSGGGGSSSVNVARLECFGDSRIVDASGGGTPPVTFGLAQRIGTALGAAVVNGAVAGSYFSRGGSGGGTWCESA